VRTNFLSVGRGAASLALLLMCAAAPRSANADALDAVSSKDASAGLRTALGQGIDAAVAHLGVPDGFLTNPKVTIPLPPALEKVERGLRLVGMGGDADTLKTAMNHAAESAVAEAKPVLKQALQRMTVNDAKGILTSDSLTTKFKPIVARATAKVKLASVYDQYAGKAAQFGLIKGEDVHLDDYVTAKALDGLFSEIADEERAIRKNPLGQASSLVKRVFGALQ
jgi:hypothetical protein